MRTARLVLVVAWFTSTASAQTPPPSSSVLDDIKTVDRPVKSFIPKYSPELFFGTGYSGTFTSTSRQWPTWVVAQVDGLLARPGAFDFGAYSQLRWGRPDQDLGTVEVAVGVEARWRFVTTSLFDIAAVLRGAYLIDTRLPGDPLIRPGVGAEFSLVRFVAAQLTYDELFSPEHHFSSGEPLLHGLSVGINVGLCPMVKWCRQVEERPTTKLDRAPATCYEAVRTCEAARVKGASAALCDAARRALDTKSFPAKWDDPVASYLHAISTPALVFAIGPQLAALTNAHDASVAGLKEYADRQRGLSSSQMLSENYGYVVTTTMVRDWLGCDADGTVIACETDAMCDQES